MLNARFVPEDRGAVSLLCNQQPRIFLNRYRVGAGCRFKPFSVIGQKFILLRLGFALPAGASVQSMGGSLILGLDGIDEGAPIPITGAPREFKGVSVNPTTLTFESGHASAEVTLAGPDVVEFLRSRGAGNTSAVLRDDAGDTTIATARLPSAESVANSQNPDLARGSVFLSDETPKPGKYTGKLPLSHTTSDGPSVDVELHSHKSWLVLALFVFLGIVIGGLATRLVALAKRRSLLLGTLDECLADYRCAQNSGETKSWRLEELLGLKPPSDSAQSSQRHPRPEATGLWQWSKGAWSRRIEEKNASKGLRLQGLNALRRSIETARSSRDLDEDSERVLNMVGRMQRWLRVEPVARLLAAVNDEDLFHRPIKVTSKIKGQKKKGKKKETVTHQWRNSQTQIDTLALLEMAQREPVEPSKADDLVERLFFQARWHHAFAAVWDAAAARSPGLVAPLLELDKSMKEDKKTAGARTADEYDALDGRLQVLVEQLPDKDGAGIPERLYPSNPEDCAPDARLAPYQWNASPDLFTGWATLDAPSYGQLSLRAATTSRARYRPGPRGYVMELLTFRPVVDTAWTFAILGVVSLGYGVTNYSNTWGTRDDLAKAFLAGLTGLAAVKWAALPIFQSARIRAAKSE